jgi:hypothetical protein
MNIINKSKYYNKNVFFLVKGIINYKKLIKKIKLKCNSHSKKYFISKLYFINQLLLLLLTIRMHYLPEV